MAARQTFLPHASKICYNRDGILLIEKFLLPRRYREKYRQTIRKGAL